jgi:hypothetical protein
VERPSSVYTRTGFGGSDYALVFSDKFKTDKRTFNEGDDKYSKEGRALKDKQANDRTWYDLSASTTRNGALITMHSENLSTQVRLLPGDVADLEKDVLEKELMVSVIQGINDRSTLIEADEYRLTEVNQRLTLRILLRSCST